MYIIEEQIDHYKRFGIKTIADKYDGILLIQTEVFKKIDTSVRCA